MRLEVILLLLVTITTKAIVNQNPVKPGCPAVNPQENLLLERFAGVWYEVQKHFSQFELGSCVSVNIGLLKESNSTILTLRHNQKIGENFTDFDQNATVRRINSVWSFKYNSSLIGEFNESLTFIYSIGNMSKRWTFFSRFRRLYLHFGNKFCQLRCRLCLRPYKFESKRTNGRRACVIIYKSNNTLSL